MTCLLFFGADVKEYAFVRCVAKLSMQITLMVNLPNVLDQMPTIDS